MMRLKLGAYHTTADAALTPTYLADSGDDVMRHVAAVEHVDLTCVAGVLGHVTDHIVLGSIAARGKGDTGHDVVRYHLCKGI